MKTIERNIYDLCEEIDLLQEELSKVRNDRDYWKNEFCNLLKQSEDGVKETMSLAFKSLLGIKTR